MIVPVAAVIAGVSVIRPIVLIALLSWPLLLAVACSGDQDEAEQEQRAAEPTPERPAPAAPPSEEIDQQEQPLAQERQLADPAELLVVEAAALEHNGYWEQALAVRDTAIASADSLDPDALTTLKLDRVRLLLRLDRPSDALAALTEISEFLPSDQSRRHDLLRARAALDLAQTDVAVEAMQDYVNTDSPAWALISLEIARALQQAGRGAAAIEWAERALGGMLPQQDRLRAIHIAATELDISGESERALQRYDELLRQSPWRDDQAAALSRTAALQRDAGNLDAARAAWRALVNDYRDHAESSEALALLLDSGVEVDQLTIGLVRFREERWVEARNAMLNVLGSSGDLAEQVAGEFYIAAIHEANGDLASAALGYVAVIGRDSTDALAAESAMRLAEFALSDGDQLAAEEYWRRVMVDHPNYERAAEAARRWASLAVSRGQWSEASLRFSEAAELAAEHWSREARQEFLYWAALMSREAGDEEAAVERAGAVVEIDAIGYYGLRAADLLAQDAPPVLEITAAEWLMRLTGESNPAETDLEALQEWQAARDLRLGGFDDAADRMLAALVDTLSNNPWALVDAAERLAALGEYRASAGAASQVMSLFGLNWTEAPPELLRLAYPRPWPEVMALHTQSEGVDPLLLWSLIRRESFYDADAEGLAGEVGLTQVIPLTGSDIAAGLGIEYAHSDLARPELAIRFGAWYLARQLEGFSNEPIMALAAYNAGPGNAARWEAEAAIAGPDGFLAALDFQSTRMYVQYVVESLAVYRALERAESSP
ncbi:MAG: lytic transglycosylase domain-containing protein [Chloroflexota bacterium]|nr:lytic transglycosylase domain-containing protein [Chloroflexota bacterium]